MNNGGPTGSVSRVGELADLLMAIAESAGDPPGQRRWESLTRLVNGQAAAGPGQVVPCAAELSALGEHPADRDRATALASAMLLRAAADTTFRRRVTDWRRQKQNQELEAPGGGGRQAAPGASAGPAAPEPRREATAKPAESGWGLDTALQVVLTAVGLLISLIALKWPFLRALPAAVVIVAVVVLWYFRRRGRPWRDRQVLLPGVACAAAAIVLVASYAVGRPPGSAATAKAGQDPGSLSVPANGSTVNAAAANAPARVEGVTPMVRDPTYNEATASTKPVSAARLAELNAAYMSGSPKAAQILASLGGAQIGSGSADVTLVGNEKSTVTITGVQVVKNCRAPLDGTLFSSSSSGIEPTLAINFNLDSETDNGNPLPGKVLTLAPGETYTLTLSAETSKYYCQFSFLLTVIGSYGTIMETVADNGVPFALTASEPIGKYHLLYVGGVGSSDDGKYAAVNPEYYY
jgi:hypothetical protein